MKKHIDCDWLFEKSSGIYICCDTRSSNKGRELRNEDVMQEACPFFHFKKREEDTGFFDNPQQNLVSEM